MDEIVLLLCMSVAVPVFCTLAGIVVAFIDRKPRLSSKEAWRIAWRTSRQSNAPGPRREDPNEADKHGARRR